MKIVTTYGEKVRQLREKRSWTQEQLAEATGTCTVRTIQRVEGNQTQGKETILAIAGALNVDLESLKSIRLNPEARLTRAFIVTSYSEFVSLEERYPSHAFGRIIMARLTEGERRSVEELLDWIFSDRDMIEPDERDLWRSYTEGIEEPLNTLFGMNLAILLIDERRDIVFRERVGLKPEVPYDENWNVRYFAVIPRHGCFRASETELLHRFSPICRTAMWTIFQGLNDPEASAYVYPNALIPVFLSARVDIKWCDVCFPVHTDGSRLDFEYLESITGLTREQMELRMREEAGDDSLLGLS